MTRDEVEMANTILFEYDKYTYWTRDSRGNKARASRGVIINELTYHKDFNMLISIYNQCVNDLEYLIKQQDYRNYIPKLNYIERTLESVFLNPDNAGEVNRLYVFRRLALCAAWFLQNRKKDVA